MNDAKLEEIYEQQLSDLHLKLDNVKSQYQLDKAQFLIESNKLNKRIEQLTVINNNYQIMMKNALQFVQTIEVDVGDFREQQKNEILNLFEVITELDAELALSQSQYSSTHEKSIENEEIIVNKDKLLAEYQLEKEKLLLGTQQLLFDKDHLLHDQDLLLKSLSLNLSDLTSSLNDKDSLIQSQLISINDKDSIIQSHLDSINDKDSIIQSQLISINEKDSIIQSHLDSINEKDSIIVEKDSIIQSHLTSINEKDSMIQSHLTSINEKDSIIQSHLTSINEKDSIIQSHVTSINKNDSIIAEMENTIQSHLNTINEKDSIIAEKDSIILEKESIIAEKDSIILEKESIINEKDIADKNDTGKKDEGKGIKGEEEKEKLEMEKRLIVLEKELFDKEKEVERLERKIEEGQWEMQRKSNQVGEKENQIKFISSQLQSLQTSMLHSEQQLHKQLLAQKAKAQEIHSLNQLLLEKDQLIDSLSSSPPPPSPSLSLLQDENSLLSQRVIDLQLSLDQLYSQRDLLSTQLLDISSHRDLLSSQLHSLSSQLLLLSSPSPPLDHPNDNNENNNDNNNDNDNDRNDDRKKEEEDEEVKRKREKEREKRREEEYRELERSHRLCGVKMLNYEALLKYIFFISIDSSSPLPSSALHLFNHLVYSFAPSLSSPPPLIPSSPSSSSLDDPSFLPPSPVNIDNNDNNNNIDNNGKVLVKEISHINNIPNVRNDQQLIIINDTIEDKKEDVLEEKKEEKEEREEEEKEEYRRMLGNIYKSISITLTRSKENMKEIAYWFSSSYRLLSLMKEKEMFAFEQYPEDIIAIAKAEMIYSTNPDERQLQDLTIQSLHYFIFLSCSKLIKLCKHLFLFPDNSSLLFISKPFLSKSPSQPITENIKVNPTVISLIDQLTRRFQDLIQIMLLFHFNHLVIHYILESLFVYINAIIFNAILQSKSPFFSSNYGFNLKSIISHLIHSVRSINPFGDLVEFFAKNELIELNELASVLVIIPNSSKDLLTADDLKQVFPSLNIAQLRHIAQQFSTSSFVYFYSFKLFR